MEEEIAELRLELKAARSDVKRYASYALRLQQELAREKQKQEDEDEVLDEEDARFQDLNDKYTGPSENYVWEKEMESSRKQHVAWGHKIERVVQMLKERQSGVAECKKRETRCGNQVDESIDSLMQELGPFLRQQKRFVEKLGRENVKLRDMLQARPTRRELLSLQLEIERLQRRTQKMRSPVKQADVHEPSSEAQQERLPPTASVDEDGTMNTASLSERILEERLLRALRVKTESTATRHKYLQEKTHCYLSLDSTKLVSKRQELTEADILERVGRICSDIVAACCYVLDVEGVGDLPRCVERAQELSNVSITYQEFVERIEKLLKRFDKDAFFSIRAQSTAETSCHEALEMVLAHINDVLVELDARREQMKPPGSKAHEVLLSNMKLLRVARIDRLTPTIRRLVDNMRAEQEFQRDLRKLFGLDDDANRKQILHVASILFGELGFLTDDDPLRERSPSSCRQSRT